MIVIRSTAELAATVRRVGREQPSYRRDIRTELEEAADILERLATDEANCRIIVNTGLNILEDELRGGRVPSLVNWLSKKACAPHRALRALAFVVNSKMRPREYRHAQ
jgi:hypothetical protein